MTESEIMIMAKAKRARAEAEASQPEEPGGLLPFFNKTVAGAAGSAVDFAGKVLRSAPEPGQFSSMGTALADTPQPTTGVASMVPEGESFGGTQSVRRGMGNLGIHTPDRDPNTVLEHAGVALGETSMALGGMLKAAQLPRALSGAPSSVGRSIVDKTAEQVYKTPLKAAGGEIGASAAIGLARDIAQDNDFSPTGKFAAETAAGVLGQTIGSGPMRTFGMTMKTLKTLGKDGFMPWTKKGGEIRAARRLRELAGGKRGVKAYQNEVARHRDLYSTPGMRGTPQMLALEKEIFKAYPQLGEKVAKRLAKESNKMARSLRGEGDPADLEVFVLNQRNRAMEAADTVVALAKKEADDAIARIGKERGKDLSLDEASKIHVEAMESAKTAITNQEEIFWDAIPPNMEVSHGEYSAEASKIIREVSSSEAEFIPRTVLKFLRKLDADMVKAAEKQLKKQGVPEDQWDDMIQAMIDDGDIPSVTTINELDGQYKVLGDILAVPNQKSKTISVANKLRKSILDDMESIQGTPEEVALVETARAFSKRKNDVFDKDPIASTLERSRGGRRVVEEEVALSKTVGRGGQQGASDQRRIAQVAIFTADELGGAVDTKAVNAIDKFLRKGFSDAAITVRDEIDASAAENFIKKHRQTLEKYPETRKKMDAFLARTDDLSTAEAGKVAAFNEWNAASSVKKRIIDGNAAEDIGKAMKDLNPSKKLSVLIKIADEDPTGKAKQGLKTAASEWLEGIITSKKNKNVNDAPVIDGEMLDTILRTKSSGVALARLFGPDEMKRLRRISHELGLIAKQDKAKGGVDIAPDKPGWLLKLGGTLVGTRAGANIAGTRGSALKLASAGSNAMQIFMNHMMNGQMRKAMVAAADNKPLYNALLNHNTDLPTLPRIKFEKAIKAWMLSTGNEFLTVEEIELLKKGESFKKPAWSRPSGTPPNL